MINHYRNYREYSILIFRFILTIFLVFSVRGRLNHEIAAALGIKERTVRFHVENILFKLGAKSRTEAAHVAFKEGWLAEDEIQLCELA